MEAWNRYGHCRYVGRLSSTPKGRIIQLEQMFASDKLDCDAIGDIVTISALGGPPDFGPELARKLTIVTIAVGKFRSYVCLGLVNRRRLGILIPFIVTADGRSARRRREHARVGIVYVPAAGRDFPSWIESTPAFTSKPVPRLGISSCSFLSLLPTLSPFKPTPVYLALGINLLVPAADFFRSPINFVEISHASALTLCNLSTSSLIPRFHSSPLSSLLICRTQLRRSVHRQILSSSIWY